MTTVSTNDELNSLFQKGQLLSYIKSVCSQLENCLNNGDISRLEPLLDSVYQKSELLDFYDNYSALIPTLDLYRRVHLLKRKLLVLPELNEEFKTAARSILESLEHYASPSTPWNYENNELKYMIFPWIEKGDGPEDTQAILRYLYFEPVAVPDDRWIAGQFYSFHDQTQSIEYFETLLDEIKVNLFFQKRSGLRQRIDIPEVRWPHYGIFFDGAVKGKSYGGAFLTLMVLWYVDSLCGSKGHQFGGYHPANVILAEIRSDGSVSPCDQLSLRMKAVLDEYDVQHLRFILAEGSQEKLELTYRQGQYKLNDYTIPGERILFVRNTTELCSAVFPGWDELTVTVWEQLSDNYKQDLLSGINDENWAKRVQQSRLSSPDSSFTPFLLKYVTAPGAPYLMTSFHISSDFDGTFDLRFGFEEGTFLMAPGQDTINEIIVLAVDGSSYAESLWNAEGENTSFISRTIFEVIQNLLRKDRTFYLHFLSCSDPELLNVNRFPTCSELEKFLQKRRRELKLPFRGNFMAPVVRYWWTRGFASNKRLIVVTNGPVFDHNDFYWKDIFWDNLWFCFETSVRRYLPNRNSIILKDIAKDIKEKLKVSPRRITRLKIVLDNWFPYEWNLSSALLKSIESSPMVRVLEFESTQGVDSLVLSGQFLANSLDKDLEYEIDIREKGEVSQVSGKIPVEKTTLLRCQTGVISGMFSEPEWEIWENFHDNSSDYSCPVCDGVHSPKLKCLPPGSQLPVLIFPSLQRFKGFAVLEPSNRQWYIAQTGLKIDEFYFFKMDNQLYVFCPSKRSQPLQVKDGTISIGSRTFYLEEL